MSIRTPARQHEKMHRRWDLPMGECWECQRERAHCRSKRRYPDVRAAAAAAIEQNEANDYARMLAPYPCPWCCSFHLTKAKRGTARWKRVEKRRRRRLAALHMEATSCP